MITVIHKICAVCGQSFKVEHPSQIKKRKYCSRECYNRSKRKEHKLSSREKMQRWVKKVNKRCPICDKLIMPKADHCHDHATYPDRKLEHHPNWKGGRFIRKDAGYVQISIGNSKHRPEHRFIWEKAHNRKLPSNWVVHHLNGIKTDNRLENLTAMPRKEHGEIPVKRKYNPNTFIASLQKRIRELEQLHLPL